MPSRSVTERPTDADAMAGTGDVATWPPVLLPLDDVELIVRGRTCSYGGAVTSASTYDQFPAPRSCPANPAKGFGGELNVSSPGGGERQPPDAFLAWL